jgi:hypothetical protein
MNSDGIQSANKTISGGNKILSPAQVVHNDYTATSAPLRLALLGQPPKANDTWAKATNNAPLLDCQALAKKRYQFINLWRSIADEPVTDMPLAMCDASTISPSDLVTLEIRYPDRTGENYFAGHSDTHKWYYFPEMTKDEAILLKVWDSNGSLSNASTVPRRTSGGVATFSLHSAFRDPAAPVDCSKRRSIEVRTIVFFDD